MRAARGPMPARTPRLDALIRTPGATRIPNPTLPILPPLGANGPPRRSPSSLGSQRLTQPASTPWARKSTHASQCCSITFKFCPSVSSRSPQGDTPNLRSIPGQRGNIDPRHARGRPLRRTTRATHAAQAELQRSHRPSRPRGACHRVADHPAAADGGARRGALRAPRPRRSGAGSASCVHGISRLQPPLASGDQGSQRRCGRGGTASSPSAVGGRQWRGCTGPVGSCRVGFA